MTKNRIGDAATTLWRQRQQRTRIGGLPDACRPADRTEGYAVQSEVVNISQQRIAGWKIAATSPAGQKHIGVDGPLAGPLLSNRVLPPGAIVPLDGNIMKVVEAEFCFRLGDSLPPRGKPYSTEEVMAAVDALHPAIEVPDSRYNAFASVGAPQLIADTACSCWFVLGPEATTDWRPRDLVTHSVTVYKGGAAAGTGSGANVLGTPRVRVPWIPNELTTFGNRLMAGQIVTTGTCVVPIAIAPAA